jgi:phosphohistidine phosphatase
VPFARHDDLVTTRTLVLLRHAKADNPAGVSDVDRPLTPRGHADATAAGAWLAGRGLVPDLVICSPSRRTRETWHGVALNLPEAPAVRYEPTVYGGEYDELLDLVALVDDDVSTLLLIGHNPVMSMLSAALDPAGADHDGLRTCGIAVHTFAGSWPECRPRSAPVTASHTARAQA